MGQHPLVVAAKWHGYYEYLHPFRDGNGKLGRLFSNFILQKMGHPIIIIPQQDKSAYIEALRAIRTEGTDETMPLPVSSNTPRRASANLSAISSAKTRTMKT